MALQGDLSSGAMQVAQPGGSNPFEQSGIQDTPYMEVTESAAGKDLGVYRGGLFVNKSAIAKEDWLRAEQSANNAYLRDLYQMREQNQFNANEAQLNRDFQERMSSTAYQRAVSDMKAAGINPVVALGHMNAASTPTGSAASSSTGAGRSGHAGGQGVIGDDPLISVISGLFKVGSSALMAYLSKGTSLAVQAAKHADDMSLAMFKHELEKPPTRRKIGF